MKNLKKKIKNKSAKIGVFGLGYVGLPLLLSFADKGFHVFGVDLNIKKINLLKNGIIDLDKYKSLAQKVGKKRLFINQIIKNLFPI